MSNINEKELIALAEQGNTEAQSDLGVCYYKGDGVEQNYEKAVKWLNKAAQPYIELCSLGKNYKENSEAYYEMYNEINVCASSWATYWLGECYLHGYGVEKNVSKAIELWELAAEEVDGVLMELANLYSAGIEFEPDYKKAVYWWEQAAHLNYDPNSGFPKARYELGVCYYEGKGVEKDLQKATKYFELAMNDGGIIEAESEFYIKLIKNEMK